MRISVQLAVNDNKCMNLYVDHKEIYFFHAVREDDEEVSKDSCRMILKNGDHFAIKLSAEELHELLEQCERREAMQP